MTPDGVVDQDHGVREFIVATGSESTAQPQNIAPNSVVHGSTFGVTKFTLKDGGYDWQYIPIPGQTFTDAGSASCHDAPGGVSGAQSTIVAAATTVLKSQTTTITVTAKDGNGNPVAGAFVTLAATGSGNTLTQPAAYTDANGVATGTLSSTVSEAKTVSSSQPREAGTRRRSPQRPRTRSAWPPGPSAPRSRKTRPCPPRRTASRSPRLRR